MKPYRCKRHGDTRFYTFTQAHPRKDGTSKIYTKRVCVICRKLREPE